jgi:hypothetical protein
METLSTLAEVGTVQDPHTIVGFLTYLTNQFTDEEGSAIPKGTTYATICVERKSDKFCIDLDDGFKWLG